MIKFFDLTVIPLPACTKGRVQAFGFDPTFAGHRCDHSFIYLKFFQMAIEFWKCSFNLINWHFEGDKIAQVRALLCINEEVRTIGGGDCNFVNSSEDAPSDTSGIILSGRRSISPPRRIILSLKTSLWIKLELPGLTVSICRWISLTDKFYNRLPLFQF